MGKNLMLNKGERYIPQYERKREIDDVTREGKFQHIEECAKVTDDSTKIVKTSRYLYTLSQLYPLFFYFSIASGKMLHPTRISSSSSTNWNVSYLKWRFALEDLPSLVYTYIPD